MKYFKSIIIVTILIFIIFSLFLANDKYIMGERVLDYTEGDIDENGEDELILLTKGVFSKYGKDIIIYSSGKEIYRKDFTELKPWKVAIGDIDGDGIDEISIGVYKTTIFHPVMDKRPFIYSYEDGEFYPKWRGSRLSRPFRDYQFYDIDGDGGDEIISIEILENDEKLVNTYKWKGFGFEGYKESNSFTDIDNIELNDGEVYIDIKDKKDKYRARVKYKGDSITIERETIQ